MTRKQYNDESLLAEIEDLLRTAPPRATIRHETDENFSWLGRVSAVIENWNQMKSPALNLALTNMNNINARHASGGYRQLMTLLQQARNDLRMKSIGPVNVAIGAGGVFDYFDEIRKVIESAKTDVYFIDPYLDAEFVSRYLAHVPDGTAIRLLAREKLKTLVPAVDTFVQQHNTNISVKSSTDFHDRYVIIDNSECYQSGASFKDGAKKSPTTLTQITDAFQAIRDTYEDLWANGNVER